MAGDAKEAAGGVEEALPRHFNVLASGQKFVSNHATSAKFTWLTGLPLALKEVLDPRTKL